MNNDRQLTEMKGIVNTPQFPGQQKGFSIEAVRTLIKKQKRTAGFRFLLETSSTQVPLAISGSARIFLGFILDLNPFTVTNFPPHMDLVINNEIVIDQTNPVFFTKQYMDDEYYFFPRPLSGQDNVILKFDAAIAETTLDVAVYYI